MNKFAVQGLRTLVMGQKELSAKEFKHFESELQRLKILTSKREESLLEFYDSMERKLEYVGSSAIEDKL